MMNCDQVFDILTRGPFPAGDQDDEAVERHLASCHECRCLAEALRPAVSLFHESMEDWQSQLPAYRGSLEFSDPSVPTGMVPRTAVMAPRTAKLTSVKSVRHSVNIFPKSGMVLATAIFAIAVVVLGFLIGTPSKFVRPRQVDVPYELGPAASNETSPRFELNETRLRFIRQFGIPASCLSMSLSESSTERHAVICCTSCHGAESSANLSREGVSTLISSCEACHTRPDENDGLAPVKNS